MFSSLSTLLDFVALFFGILSVLLTVGYTYLMTIYRKGWDETPTFQIPRTWQPKTFLSVIIPARNEVEHIEQCVRSILDQSYPEDLYEIIVVDDHSDDGTAQVVESIQHPLVKPYTLHNGEGKKAALAFGISQSKGSLIVTTDADCIASPNWLKLLSAFHDTRGAVFIAAPVLFHDLRSFFQSFQALDFAGMMAITGACITRDLMLMSNGANLAYTRAVYDQVNGFEGIDQIASGDDMLLMEKIAQLYPEGIGFLKSKEAITFTKPQESFIAFLNQRIRWGSKSSGHTAPAVTLMLGIAFLFCFSLLVNGIIVLLGGLHFLWLLLLQIIVKAIVDYRLLKEATRFFDRSNWMHIFWPALFVHVLYIAIVGSLAGVIKEYNWKGRRVR